MLCPEDLTRRKFIGNACAGSWRDRRALRHLPAAHDRRGGRRRRQLHLQQRGRLQGLGLRIPLRWQRRQQRHHPDRQCQLRALFQPAHRSGHPAGQRPAAHAQDARRAWAQLWPASLVRRTAEDVSPPATSRSWPTPAASPIRSPWRSTRPAPICRPNSSPTPISRPSGRVRSPTSRSKPAGAAACRT